LLQGETEDGNGAAVYLLDWTQTRAAKFDSLSCGSDRALFGELLFRVGPLLRSDLLHLLFLQIRYTLNLVDWFVSSVNLVTRRTFKFKYTKKMETQKENCLNRKKLDNTMCSTDV
jgi:hypothetical protein